MVELIQNGSKSLVLTRLIVFFNGGIEMKLYIIERGVVSDNCWTEIGICSTKEKALELITEDRKICALQSDFYPTDCDIDNYHIVERELDTLFPHIYYSDVPKDIDSALKESLEEWVEECTDPFEQYYVLGSIKDKFENLYKELKVIDKKDEFDSYKISYK